MSGAPEISGLERYLAGAGFVNIDVFTKEESKEIIKQWLPGSGAEDYVVSAQIQARKPVS